MFLVLHLNSRLQPKHRFELEDALTKIFEENNNIGEVTGGGTEMFPNGEIASCDIELEFSDKPDDIEWLVGLLNNIGIPKGSSLNIGEEKRPVGSLEGLGLYLNANDLPEDVYKNNDINELIRQLGDALGKAGHLFSWRELDEFTSLFFYGTTFDEMNEKIKEIVSSHPLCEKCRIEKTA